MTAAGLDPSRIQERATLLAKVQGAKRKRAAEMDVEMDDVEGEGEDDDDWMDVDGEEAPNKRAKGNAGRAVAVNSRAPRTNRQLAGMRDEGVCFRLSSARCPLTDFVFCCLASGEGRQTAQSWTETTQHARKSWGERSRYQSQDGTHMSFSLAFPSDNLGILQPKHLFGIFTPSSHPLSATDCSFYLQLANARVERQTADKAF